MKSFEDMSIKEVEARLETAKKEFTRLYMEGKSETLAFNLAEREYQAILWYVSGLKRGLSEARRYLNMDQGKQRKKRLPFP